MSEKNNEYKKLIGLYIHIPFCESKCNYCDFLSFHANEELHYQYVESLIHEIKSYKNVMKEYRIDAIYIGGGTPSSINAYLIDHIITTIKENFEISGYNNSYEAAEITIEINPGTVNVSKLKRYYDAGVNRISFGLQSANDKELKLLGRIHNFNDFVENYNGAREVGFKNINVDLISSLPNQNTNHWLDTLNKVIEFKPEHISAYSLIIEEGTPFYKMYVENKENNELLPTEDVEREIYKVTNETLQEAGYDRYEISNYARPGYESKHNTSYWIGKDYLGLGLGAASYIEGVRFNNHGNINVYIKNIEGNLARIRKDILDDNLSIRKNIEKLSQQAKMEEFMFLGLRLIKGISKLKFKQQFSIDINEVYGEVIHNMISKELLVSDDDRIYLTEYGIDISNYVLSEFLLN